MFKAIIMFLEFLKKKPFISMTSHDAEVRYQNVPGHPFSFAPLHSIEQLNSTLRHSLSFIYGGVRGVMGIVVGNGHGDTSSNPGRG